MLDSILQIRVDVVIKPTVMDFIEPWKENCKFAKCTFSSFPIFINKMGEGNYEIFPDFFKTYEKVSYILNQPLQC